jgi:hypothetical protein
MLNADRVFYLTRAGNPGDLSIPNLRMQREYSRGLVEKTFVRYNLIKHL